jgi:hypothetical protein
MSEEEAVVVPFGKNEHSLLPQSGSNLTPGKLVLQDASYDLSGIVRDLATEAQYGALHGGTIDARLMARRITRLAAVHTLDELRQLPQLEFLRH